MPAPQGAEWAGRSVEMLLPVLRANRLVIAPSYTLWLLRQLRCAARPDHERLITVSGTSVFPRRQ
jgi:hypothetical protein